jgi:hypothetical protein
LRHCTKGDIDPFTLTLLARLAEPSGGGTGFEEANRQKARAKALGALDFLLAFHGHRGWIQEDTGRKKKPRDGEEGAEAGAYTRPHLCST